MSMQLALTDPCVSYLMKAGETNQDSLSKTHTLELHARQIAYASKGVWPLLSSKWTFDLDELLVMAFTYWMTATTNTSSLVHHCTGMPARAWLLLQWQRAGLRLEGFSDGCPILHGSAQHLPIQRCRHFSQATLSLGLLLLCSCLELEGLWQLKAGLQLGQGVQGILPLWVPLRGQLPLRAHHFGLGESLPQGFSSQQHLFRLIWTRADAKGLNHLALLQHRCLRRRPASRPILRSRALCGCCHLRNKVLVHAAGTCLKPRISHMVSSRCLSAIIGCKGIRKVRIVLQPPLGPPLCHPCRSHPFHCSLCTGRSFACSL